MGLQKVGKVPWKFVPHPDRVQLLQKSQRASIVLNMGQPNTSLLNEKKPPRSALEHGKSTQGIWENVGRGQSWSYILVEYSEHSGASNGVFLVSHGRLQHLISSTSKWHELTLLETAVIWRNNLLARNTLQLWCVIDIFEDASPASETISFSWY